MRLGAQSAGLPGCAPGWGGHRPSVTVRRRWVESRSCACRLQPSGPCSLFARLPLASHDHPVPSLRPAHFQHCPLPLLARGKVRDNYAVGDDRILMVARTASRPLT